MSEVRNGLNLVRDDTRASFVVSIRQIAGRTHRFPRSCRRSGREFLYVMVTGFHLRHYMQRRKVEVRSE